MAATVVFYNKVYTALGNAEIDLNSHTFKVSLHSASYTPDVDAHDFRDDLTNEASGPGYTAGGNTLVSPTWTQDNGNNRTVWDFDDPTWSNVSITFRYAVIYRSVGSAATDILVGYIDYGANQTISGVDLTIPINAAGFMALRQAP